MENSVKENIAVIEKKTIAENENKTVKNNSEIQDVIKTSVENVLKSKTDYDATQMSVMRAMIKRIENSDSVQIIEEISKMKGQSEARYLEILAKISAVVRDTLSETASLMEKSGLQVRSKSVWEDLKKGILVVGDDPAIRISIPQMIASAYLLRNTNIFFEVGRAPVDPKIMDFFYQNGGQKSIRLRNRPVKLKPAGETLIPVKDIISLSTSAGGAGVYTHQGQTLEEFKAAWTAATFTDMTVTYSVDADAVDLVKIVNGHASNNLFIETDTEVSLKTTLSLKKMLIGAVALATTKVHGVLGIGVALFGEEAVSKLTADIQKDLPASILG